MNNQNTSYIQPIYGPSYKFDKLSLVYSEKSPDHSFKTADLLIGNHINKFIPGMHVTTNARYKASARIPITVDADGTKQVVVLEAGPKRPWTAAYRLEFNPDKLKAHGMAELHGLLATWVDEDPVVFMAMSRVTRCDVALDLPGLCVANVLVKCSGLRKHAVYSDQYGNPQTVYSGTAKSRRIAAYDKDLFGNGETSLRLECRIKPQCYGYQLVSVDNPFEKVRLLPANFMAGCGLGIPWELVADTMRIGGLKRALRFLEKKQRNSLKHALAEAETMLPDPAALWAAWPQTLISCGLGKELGAIPVNFLTPKAA